MWLRYLPQLRDDQRARSRGFDVERGWDLRRQLHHVSGGDGVPGRGSMAGVRAGDVRSGRRAEQRVHAVSSRVFRERHGCRGVCGLPSG